MSSHPNPSPFSSTLPQPTSFSHSRKNSYPAGGGPHLTLAGPGMAMLGGPGMHKRSGSDLSVGGGGGMVAVGVGLSDGEGGYESVSGWTRGAEEDGNGLYPSHHQLLPLLPSFGQGQHQQPSYAHLTRQDQLLYSSHSRSLSSGSSLSPTNSSAHAHHSNTHSRNSSISSNSSAHSRRSQTHSRSGSFSNLGSMNIEPQAQGGGGTSYHEYNPSSLSLDVHSHGEGAGGALGTLPPSALNFSHSNSSSSSVIVPSHSQGPSESGYSPNRSLRNRGSVVRSAPFSQKRASLNEEDMPSEIREEGERLRDDLGKEAEKDKCKMDFADFWLRTSYSRSEKATVSRQALFHSYNISCENLGLKTLNSASFGKAVRGRFLGIQTRRLGVRGNSKYHYCGIRPITKYEMVNLASFGDGTGGTHWSEPNNSSSEVEMSGGSGDDEDDGEGSDEEGFQETGEMQTDEGDLSGSEVLLGNDLKRSHSMAALRTPSQKAFDDLKTPTAAQHPSSDASNANNAFDPPAPSFLSNLQPKHPSPTLGPAPAPRVRPTSATSSSSSNRARRHTTTSTFGGAAFSAPAVHSVTSLPSYPSLFDAGPLPSNTSPGRAARSVWSKFNAHLDALFESVRALRFDMFEINMRTFWQLPEDEREVCHAPSLAGTMARAETVVYDAILEHLKSQIFVVLTPAAITSLRSLSQNLEQILVSSLEEYSASFAEPKVELGARFGHLLLRFLDIYQISSALATLLSNDQSVADIDRTFDSIDFESIRNHVALVCNCRPEQLLQILEVELRQQLKQVAYQAAMNPGRPGSADDALTRGVKASQQLLGWADTTIDRLLASQARDAEKTGKSASPRGILIRWSFVTSEIMRDLTIRSDPCFGSFQILKIAFDEWIGFKVLRSVALSTTSVAASVDSVVQQTFFALSPLVEDGFSQHPSNYQPQRPVPLPLPMHAVLGSRFPNINNPQLFLDPHPHHQQDPPSLYPAPPLPPPPQRRNSGFRSRSRASSTASSSHSYEPTMGGFQQPPRPSQYQNNNVQHQHAPFYYPTMGESPAPTSYSTPGSNYGLDDGAAGGIGDLQRLVEGQHLGGMEGLAEGGGKGW